MNTCYPHRMRLREPWTYEPHGHTIRCRRRFGRPSRLDDYERVWLVFEGVKGRAQVSLNGQDLGSRQEGHFEFDVTNLLRENNDLVLHIETTDGRRPLWDEVAMDVRCLAWLKDIDVRFIDDDGKRLVVDGIVAGTADGLLELYVVLDRTPLLYTTVTPKPEGAPFHLRSEPVTDEVAAKGVIPVRVELVKGAVAWFTFETLIRV
jgi:hypothetical protein